MKNYGSKYRLKPGNIDLELSNTVIKSVKPRYSRILMAHLPTKTKKDYRVDSLCPKILSQMIKSRFLCSNYGTYLNIVNMLYLLCFWLQILFFKQLIQWFRDDSDFPKWNKGGKWKRENESLTIIILSFDGVLVTLIFDSLCL